MAITLRSFKRYVRASPVRPWRAETHQALRPGSSTRDQCAHRLHPRYYAEAILPPDQRLSETPTNISHSGCARDQYETQPPSLLVRSTRCSGRSNHEIAEGRSKSETPWRDNRTYPAETPPHLFLDQRRGVDLRVFTYRLLPEALHKLISSLLP